MRALFFEKSLRYADDIPKPQPSQHEALIRITHAGICNTDLEIMRGYMEFTGIPGHEFVGVVEESPDRQLVGKRVVGEINVGCGRCEYCKSGLANHCAGRTVLGILNRNGAFAEYTTLPLNNLYVVPDSVSDKEALFTEPVAAAFEICHQVADIKSKRVCVLGDGKLGLLIAQVLAYTGAHTLVVGKHEEKLSLLKDKKIETTLLSSFDASGFDIVVECTGSHAGIEHAMSIVRPQGTVVLKTTAAEQGTVDLNELVINEISLVGSRCGPFPDAVRALESGALDLLPLISEEYSLEEGVTALEHAARKGVLKVILKVT